MVLPDPPRTSRAGWLAGVVAVVLLWAGVITVFVLRAERNPPPAPREFAAVDDLCGTVDLSPIYEVYARDSLFNRSDLRQERAQGAPYERTCSLDPGRGAGSPVDGVMVAFAALYDSVELARRRYDIQRNNQAPARPAQLSSHWDDAAYLQPTEGRHVADFTLLARDSTLVVYVRLHVAVSAYSPRPDAGLIKTTVLKVANNMRATLRARPSGR